MKFIVSMLVGMILGCIVIIFKPEKRKPHGWK